MSLHPDIDYTFKGGCFNGHDSPVNFREWLQFLGPCFEEKVLNGTYDPSTCPPTISKDMQKNLTRDHIFINQGN